MILYLQQYSNIVLTNYHWAKWCPWWKFIMSWTNWFCWDEKKVWDNKMFYTILFLCINRNHFAYEELLSLKGIESLWLIACKGGNRIHFVPLKFHVILSQQNWYSSHNRSCLYGTSPWWWYRLVPLCWYLCNFVCYLWKIIVYFNNVYEIPHVCSK